MFDCDPATVVDQQIAAWRARDAEAFAAFYAPDAVIMDFPATVTSTGREEIQAHYARSFARSPAGLQLSIRTRIVSGEYVIDEEVLTVGRGQIEAVVIYRVQGCLITRADLLPSQTRPLVAEAGQ